MIGPVELDYYACDLRSGVILEQLKSFAPSGVLGVRLGESTTANGDLDLSKAPVGWDDATVPGRSMIVAVDRALQQPLWAALVLTRAGGSAVSASFGLATTEAYFDRRYTGPVAITTTTDQAVIMTEAGGALAVDAPNFVFDAPNSGTTLDSYAVADGDDRTILSVWTELMGMGGVEFMVSPQWQDAARTTIKLVIVIREQVGVQDDIPETVLKFPGCVSDYALTESYEAGKGATDVMAWGSGQGDSRLKSAVHTATALLSLGWPSWVYRFSPTAGADDPVQLDLAAASALTQMSPGANSWTVTCVASKSPRVATDWDVGDSIRLQVIRSPRHPKGVDVVHRCYGWDLDPAADTVTPILVEEDN